MSRSCLETNPSKRFWGFMSFGLGHGSRLDDRIAPLNTSAWANRRIFLYTGSSAELAEYMALDELPQVFLYISFSIFKLLLSYKHDLLLNASGLHFCAYIIREPSHAKEGPTMAPPRRVLQDLPISIRRRYVLTTIFHSSLAGRWKDSSSQISRLLHHVGRPEIHSNKRGVCP